MKQKNYFTSEREHNLFFYALDLHQHAQEEGKLCFYLL